MSDLSSKRDEFERRLDAIQARRGGNSLRASDAASRLAAWEDLLDRRVEEYRQHWNETGGDQTPAASLQADIPVSPRPQASQPETASGGLADPALPGWVKGAEHTMLVDFGLEKHPRLPGFQAPYSVATNDTEMVQAVARACGVEPDRLPFTLDQLPGVVHLPGEGTWINQRHFFEGPTTPAQPPGKLATHIHLAGDIARERWGWGFLLEYTTLGQHVGKAGLWPLFNARRLGVPVQASPSLELVDAIRESWMLTETGWADWVWQYIMFKARQPLGVDFIQQPRPARIFELLTKVINLFPLIIIPFGVPVRMLPALDLASFLFLDQSEILPQTLNSLVLWMQKNSLQFNQKVCEVFGQTLSLIAGRLSLAQVEATVGIASMPYALLVSSHLPELDFKELSTAEQYRHAIEQDPRLNPDTRLLLLARLNSRVKYNPRTMFTAAWERFRLGGPGEYFG